MTASISDDDRPQVPSPDPFGGEVAEDGQEATTVVGHIVRVGAEERCRVEASDAGGPGFDADYLHAEATAPQAVEPEVRGGVAGTRIWIVRPDARMRFYVNDECPCGDEPEPTGDGIHPRSDNTAWMGIRAYQVSGAPKTCAPYTLMVTNGD
ncbi:MAG: hypothetical protein ACQEXJ_22655 [Myxococcota bacterium]